MTKFCQRCMQQCQHEKSQFCTLPGSPANLTKQGFLQCEEGATIADPCNWKMKARSFLHYASLCAAFGSVQFLCPGNFSILATPLMNDTLL